MNNAYVLIRAIRGPLLLMALGALMALHRFQEVSFVKTWPVLLILLGVMKLLERMVMRPGQPATPEGGAGTRPHA
ncbi:MAG: hypothetical protein HY858_11475 [Candidatus Solibacter usitatus]|nr:hypothetical protein [Candidatus Solibacter usitatus]